MCGEQEEKGRGSRILHNLKVWGALEHVPFNYQILGLHNDFPRIPMATTQACRLLMSLHFKDFKLVNLKLKLKFRK